MKRERWMTLAVWLLLAVGGTVWIDLGDLFGDQPVLQRLRAVRIGLAASQVWRRLDRLASITEPLSLAFEGSRPGPLMR